MFRKGGVVEGGGVSPASGETLLGRDTVFQALPGSGEQRHVCVAGEEGGECFPFKGEQRI